MVAILVAGDTTSGDSESIDRGPRNIDPQLGFYCCYSSHPSGSEDHLNWIPGGNPVLSIYFGLK